MMIKPMSQPFQDTDWKTLRFYGLLTHEQRAMLRQGTILIANQLSAEQKEALTVMAIDPPFPDFDFMSETMSQPRISGDPNDHVCPRA